jgi:hypothetical protein
MRKTWPTRGCCAMGGGRRPSLILHEDIPAVLCMSSCRGAQLGTGTDVRFEKNMKDETQKSCLMFCLDWSLHEELRDFNAGEFLRPKSSIKKFCDQYAK